MRRASIAAVLAIPAFVAVLSADQNPPPAQAQQPPAGQGRAGGGGGRGQQTPEQREAAAKEAHDKEAALANPIAARDSVWIEELTYLEVRDAIKAGKTTALVMAGSTENNGPWMAGGKHQFAMKLVGESVARKLGDALVAPMIPYEAGNPDNKYMEWGSIYFSADTFKAVVRDISNSLKNQGFKHVMLLGDSGGNTAGMRAVAEELTAAWAGAATIAYIPEYYNWTSKGGVRDFVTSNGIPEKINADGIHDEYGLSAVMMAFDPKLIHFDERVKDKKATINGISLEPKDKTVEMGKKIVEFRANQAVDAIKKARGGK